ncbi:MAG: hypothetical protein AAF502_11400 [Bacteroidota bacterium]
MIIFKPHSNPIDIIYGNGKRRNMLVIVDANDKSMACHKWEFDFVFHGIWFQW